MIVKNEAHVILDTFKNITSFIRFDYWVISDTGSTDKTKECITEFFKERGIPGEIVDTPWKNFGYNRSVALEKAYRKTDYVFVWDADDEIYGDFVMPDPVADSYKFTFGNESGLRYSRCQLFKNTLRWKYEGVLHEYATCMEPSGPSGEVRGNYYFISGRKGDRSKDPNKYMKDALILKEAFYERKAAGDPIHERYAFYCGNSYLSANDYENAIEFYKIVLTLNNWVQEKYMSCLEIYDSYERLNKPLLGIPYLVESYKYDPKRMECFYRLIKYYCIHGQCDIAYMYYTMVQNYMEKEFLTDDVSNKLFVKKAEYDFFLPYYMVIVGERTNHHDTAVKMYDIIFKTQYLHSGEWWIHNLFHNIQFVINEMPADVMFVKNMLEYINKLRSNRVFLKDDHNLTVQKIITKFRPVLGAPTPLPRRLTASATAPVSAKIMLSITTCKRLKLFQETVNSMLKVWKDLLDVDYFFCVDDNSSEEDRTVMKESYPFFNYYMKTPGEKGHRESMNIIYDELKRVQPTYWIHMEDDWLFTTPASYVSNAIKLLEKYENQNIHQIVYNRNYGLMFSDFERVGGILLEPGLILHEHRQGLVGKNCGYWPHYSLQPSITRARVVLELGNYDSANTFFERDYANKYNAAGYKTAFYDSIHSLHIGKQHWEKEGQNAYSLNETSQFAAKTPVKEEAVKDVPVKDVPVKDVTDSSLKGNMSDHLAQVLEKINAGTPFGLIRPSDGEHTVLKNTTLTNCDNWTFTSGGKLQKQLAEAVSIQDPNLYIGIPCNKCNNAWCCNDNVHEDYMNRFKVPLAQRTYANIFGNANWETTQKFVESHEFYAVTSGTNPCKQIKDRFLINNYLVNDWDKVGEEETKRLLTWVEGIGSKGNLFLFSAGPISKIWIPMCMKANPSNTYIDIGGALDLFTKGMLNRPYGRFKDLICVFVPPTALTGKKYTWQDKVIEFRITSVKTPWTTGTYEFLAPQIVKASWGGFEHLLTFDTDYTKFTSVRTDGDTISGLLV